MHTCMHTNDSGYKNDYIFTNFVCTCYVAMVHRWYSGVFHRKSFSISNICYTSVNIMCDPDYYCNSD